MFVFEMDPFKLLSYRVIIFRSANICRSAVFAIVFGMYALLKMPQQEKVLPLYILLALRV